MNGNGRHALVLGGCGNVGSGVVGGFLRAGHSKVVVLSRDPQRLDELRTACGVEASQRLVVIVGDIGSEGGAEAAYNEVCTPWGFPCGTLAKSKPQRVWEFFKVLKLSLKCKETLSWQWF